MDKRLNFADFEIISSFNNGQSLPFHNNLDGGGRQQESQTVGQLYQNFDVPPHSEAFRARNWIIASSHLSDGASSSRHLEFPLSSTLATTPTGFYNGFGNRNSFSGECLSDLSYLQERRLPGLTMGWPGRGQMLNAMEATPLLPNPSGIVAEILAIARTPQGAYLLQKNLEEGNRDMIDMIIAKVTKDLPVLMVHQTGWKFARKVFELSVVEQTNRIIQSVVCTDERSFINICNNCFGKQAVKALIRCLKTPLHEIIIATVIKNHILNLVNFSNGHEVIIEFLISCISDVSRKLIFTEMATNCMYIATDRVGCLLLQKCIYPFIEKDVVDVMLQSIIENSVFLSDEPYGNYVVQHVLTFQKDDLTDAIVEHLAGTFGDLATNKFGSNVVEACLRSVRKDGVRMIVNELSNSTNFLSIIQDPFGNYVIQSALKVSVLMDREIYENLVRRIEPHASLLLSHPFGRMVLHKAGGPW